eukprot:TRINITY_DN120770_c0_g1_i1.p2 TRINITY_DN120770_c0_g1~~TRINITY_DN120770_c0_g1_i1.p2  ORF type:complete len:147 (-),score=36.28 TRINITY_DN120770_c0_g1_i1:158-598(-)
MLSQRPTRFSGGHVRSLTLLVLALVSCCPAAAAAENDKAPPVIRTAQKAKSRIVRAESDGSVSVHTRGVQNPKMGSVEIEAEGDVNYYMGSPDLSPDGKGVVDAEITGDGRIAPEAASGFVELSDMPFDGDGEEAQPGDVEVFHDR